MSDVAEALQRIESPGHDLEQAFSACYPELKRIARARLRGSGLQGEMQTTALVHDSYVRLAGRGDLAFPDRLQFFAYASRVLRSIVVDLVREQKAQRRGGDVEVVTLDTALGEGLAPSMDVEDVNGALEDLARLDPGLARLVEMRFFGGMGEDEVAEALGVSKRTVSREWQKARALLLTLLEE